MNFWDDRPPFLAREGGVIAPMGLEVYRLYAYMGQGLWLQDCSLWSSSASKQFQKVGKLEGSAPCLSACAKQVSSTAHETGYFMLFFSKTDFYDQ